MAVIAKQRYKLDIAPKGGWVIVYASQHDNGAREIEFEITNQGNAYSIPASINISVQGVKSNKGYFSHSCSYSGNIVKMALANDMTDVIGKAICVLKFTNSSQQKLATAKFILNVDSDSSSEGIIIDTEAEEIFNQMLNEIRAQAASVSADIAELQSMVGSPLVASTASAMTDHNKIYVYTGSESGYTRGNWYYWNGSAWTYGGVYNSTAIETDKTLSVDNMPADAKVTGNAIVGLEDEVGVFRWNRKYLIILNTNPANLTPVSNSGIDCVVIDCVVGDKFVVTASGGNQPRAWGFLDSDNHVLSVANANTQVNELELTAPTNATKLVVNNKTVDGIGRVYKIGNNLESRVKNLEEGITGPNPILNSGVGIILNSILGKLALKDPSYSYVASNIAKLFNDDAPIDSQNVIESIQYIPFNINPYGAKVGSTTYNILRKEVQTLSRFSVNGPLPYNGYRINAMPGYYITVYEIRGDIEFYGKTWNGGDWGSSNIVDGGFGIVSNPSASWVTTYQSNDSSVKWVQIKFKKENDEVFTPYEFTHMYGTVYTIVGTVPSVEQMLSNIEIGGRVPLDYDDADNVRYIYPTKNNITTRCRTKILPISKGTIVAKDGYSFTAYDVDYMGLQKLANQPDLKANGYPGYVKRHEIFTNSMFVVYVIKKDDNTEFIQSEMSGASNMIGYEGGDIYDVI